MAFVFSNYSLTTDLVFSLGMTTNPRTSTTATTMGGLTKMMIKMGHLGPMYAYLFVLVFVNLHLNFFLGFIWLL